MTDQLQLKDVSAWDTCVSQKCTLGTLLALCMFDVWWDKCWALHLYTCLRQWRQGRADGANAFVTQENHESVCAWRATVSILGNGFTCTCPCQDLKFWRFEVSVFLKTIMLRPFFGVFWHMSSCCTVCQQFYSEKFSGCLGCVPILKMQSLHMWSKAIPSIVVHRCTFTVTLASASDLICVFLVCTNAQFVFAYYEGTHSMYLHSMNTQCICILSAHAAPYRGIWHQHRVCSSLAKTSQNSEKPWQLWRRGERGCTFTVLQSWWRPWTSFGNCRNPWFPAVSWQKQKSMSPGTLDIRGNYVSWIDPILLSIAQDTQLLWEQSFIEHLEITYCAALVYGRLYK